jgi:uncharacterized protein involved in exopolysaccharide biosynthesis
LKSAQHPSAIERLEDPMRHPLEMDPALVRARPEVEPVDLGFAEVVALLAANRRAIVASILISMTVALVYLLFATPQYTATALLLIDSKNSTPSMPQVAPTDANSESAYVDTQVRILGSDRIIRKVIFEQKLYELKEFEQKIDIAPAASPEASAENRKTGGEENFDVISAAAVKEFRTRLDVRRSPSIYIIDINFTFRDPEKAATIANAVSNAYIDDQARSREQAIDGTSQWLRLRTMELRKETQAAETALDEFRNSNPGVGASSRSILRDLESTAQTYRLISESFQKRLLETSQQLYFLAPEARVVSKAWPPSEKSYPRKTLTFAVAAALGMAIGFLIALFRGAGGYRARTEP